MQLPAPTKKAAAVRYLRACGSYVHQTMTLRSFYGSARKAINLSTKQIADESKSQIEQLLASDEGNLLKRSSANLPPDFIFEIQEVMTQFSIRHTNHSINAACVVFAHSQLDSLLSRCCEVSYLAMPSIWQANLQKQKRKVDLSEISKKTAKQLLHESAEAEVRQMSRESIKKRLDILEAVCRPKSKSKLVTQLNINRVELEKLDQLRQKIIHGLYLKVSDTEAEHTIHFVFRSGLYLLFLVGDACGMKRTITGVTGLEREFLRLFSFVRREFPEFIDLFKKYADNFKNESHP